MSSSASSSSSSSSSAPSAAPSSSSSPSGSSFYTASSSSSSKSDPSSSTRPHYTLDHQSPHQDDPTTSSSAQPPRYTHAHDPPFPTSSLSLREPPQADIIPTTRPTLTQFRNSEGPAVRAAKLDALWKALPNLPTISEVNAGPTATQKMKLPGQDTRTALSPERAERLRRLYEEELVRSCSAHRPEARLWGGADDIKPGTATGKGIAWENFRRFLWDQERQLWDMFQELDKNADGRLDATEMRAALSRSGIDITPSTADDLVRFLASGASDSGSGSSKSTQSAGPSEKDMYITFAEFRDFLIMLPRKATPFEIYKYYQVKKRYSDGRGAARVDKEGDLNVSFPKPTLPTAPATTSKSKSSTSSMAGDEDDFADTVDVAHKQKHGGEDDQEDDQAQAVGSEDHQAWRFLLAGGVAGAVSRSVTAPFDRLKVYLITTDNPHVQPRGSGGAISRSPFKVWSRAVGNLGSAVRRIYVDGGGVRAFWVGNGLNVTKIFPESAIKFVSYEQTKLFLAKYWDCVSDPSELSSSSRFFAGGVGGITSQFAIYGLETLKTRVQSEVGPAQGFKAVKRMAASMWATGGIKAYYRGLTLGLIGVFPYSAIDMGTYETLKKAYIKSTGKDEPEVYAVLSFGALSGSIGAASVYPINLLRTRLQASGSSGHRHQYTGFVDVAQQTIQREGWRGLYKGLLPSILKVGPAVGVSWIVYEDVKRRLGV